MRLGFHQSVLVLLPAARGNAPKPSAHAADRRGVPGLPVLRCPSNGAPSSASGPCRRPQTGFTPDGEDGAVGHLPEAEDQ